MNIKKKIVDIGSKFAEHLGKPYNFEMICWFSKKMVRTSCTCIKKQKLLWAVFASSRNILNNFTELDDIMEKNELADKPHRIFKFDEKGIFHFTLITCCYIFFLDIFSVLSFINECLKTYYWTMYNPQIYRLERREEYVHS